MNAACPEVTGKKAGSFASSPVEPMALSINDACAALGISRSHIYVLMNRGDLRLVKLGRKSVVPRAEIRRLLGEAA